MNNKFGIHAIEPYHSMDYVRELKTVNKHFSVVKCMDNTGLAIEVKSISPETITITRFFNPLWDSANGIELDNFPFQQAVNDCINLILNRTNPEIRSKTDFFEIVNEADPPNINGWRNYGRFLKLLIEQANLYNIKLAIPAFNAGTPEWDEFLALCESGLFTLMKQTGHVLAIHEGVFGLDTPVNLYFPSILPNGWNVPNAGALNIRYRHWRYILEQRNETVPFIITEWYAGGGWGNYDSNEQILERFKWYHNELLKDDYVIGFCPFTIGASNGWEWSSYEFIYPTLVEYIKNTEFINPIPPQNNPNKVRIKNIKSIYDFSSGKRNFLGFLFGNKLWNYLSDEGDYIKIGGEFYIKKGDLEFYE